MSIIPLTWKWRISFADHNWSLISNITKIVNTVVVHPGALGDVLLSLRAIRSLKRSFSQNTLVWVGQNDIGNLLMNSGEVDQALSVDGCFLSDLFCSSDRWNTETRKILESCTHFVCWLRDSDQRIENNLKAMKIPEWIILSPYDTTISYKHAEDKYLETLRVWGIAEFEFSEKLRILETSQPSCFWDDLEGSHSLYPQMIAIHPGSGSKNKCSAPSLLASVVERLLQVDHRQFVIIEGPADQDVVQKFCSVSSFRYYTLLQNHSLTSVAMYLAKVDLFIGHDSGLTHLAAACGIPSIALFGPTDPDQWAPRGSHVSVIRGEPCQCIDWSQVQACHLKPCINISAERVVEQAERWLRTSKEVKLRSSTVTSFA